MKKNKFLPLGANAEPKEILHDMEGESEITKETISEAGGLVTPDEQPLETVLVGVNNEGEQTNIGIGAGLQVQNGVLKSTFTTVDISSFIEGDNIPVTQEFINQFTENLLFIKRDSYRYTILCYTNSIAATTIVAGYNYVSVLDGQDTINMFIDKDNMTMSFHFYTI